MPAHPRLVRLDVLTRADRAALVRLLSPFRAFFDSQGVSLPALAKAPQPDRAGARRLLAAAHDRSAPDTLRALLEALDTLATPAGAAEIVRLDVDARLPRGALGEENLALAALLETPDLSRDALRLTRAVRAARDPSRAYTDSEPSDGRAIAYLADMKEALERLLATGFEARDSTRYARVLVTETEEAWVFEIGHGERPRTREIVDTKSLALALVTDVAAHRA
jgi:hypothetical protein